MKPKTPSDRWLEEVYNRSPAMQLASKFLGGLGTKAKDEKLSLADKFIEDTHRWAKFFEFDANTRKRTDNIPRYYRQAMNQAKRFVLDDQFTEYATEVSNRTSAEKLLYRLQFATLPYDVTWIEFDLHIKVRTMRAYHNMEGIVPGVSQRLGLLLERVNDTMATCTLVCEALKDDEMTVPNLTGYLFSLDERDLRSDLRYRGITPFAMLDRIERDKGIWAEVAERPYAREHMHRVAKSSLWGFAHGGHGVIKSIGDLVHMASLPDFLARHGDAGFSRFYDYFEIARRTKVMGKIAEIINGEISEFAGTIRWVVTLLAMLNEVPTRSELVVPGHQIYYGPTQKRQAYDFHKITLSLPKTKPVPFIERHLSAVDRRHKAHQVRSHWRTYLSDSACKREEHEWEYDYNEGYRLCGKCMAFGRLIHEHVRGDPSLGWVSKDYTIRKSGNL